MMAKTNNIQILQKTATNQYPAYALKSDDSKNQQYPNPTENNNKPILLQYARVAWHVRPEKTEAGKLFYLWAPSECKLLFPDARRLAG